MYICMCAYACILICVFIDYISILAAREWGVFYKKLLKLLHPSPRVGFCLLFDKQCFLFKISNAFKYFFQKVSFILCI